MRNKTRSIKSHSLLERVASLLTIATLLVGSVAALFSGPFGPLVAAADTEGAPVISQVGAVPSSGTLGVGDQLQVYFQEANDEDNLTIPSGSVCDVNDVNVASTFQNLTDGLYKVTYTVGANDNNQATGQIPVNCTFVNDNSEQTTATAWTDNNTTAIDTSVNNNNGNGGGNNNGGGTGTTTAPQIQAVAAIPSSGTLDPGENLQAYIQVANDVDDLTLSGSCLVNGQNVNSTFQNETDGLYEVNYIIGANDPSSAAGDIPINCTLTDANGSVTASAWTDSNTTAISTGNTGGGNGGGSTATTTTPVITSSVSPNSGTLTTGNSLTVNLQEANNESDLTLVGGCLINGQDVNSTFHNKGGGLYQLTYTVGANDPSQSAGNIPVDCELTNGAGATTVVTSWSDHNTVAVNTSSGGNGGGGTGTTTAPMLEAVATVPNEGTIGPGQELQVYIRELHGMEDLAISGTCLVNGQNVNSSFMNETNGLYEVSYVVGANDPSAAAGQIPINCTLADSAGSMTASALTDGNTVAISTSNTGGNGNGNGGGNNTSTTTTTGTISGTVNSQNGVLAVDSIDPVQTTAVADGNVNDGWSWIFNITVPTNETSFSMQFGNWTNTSDSSETIPVAGNMMISSDQASTSTPVTITGANTYTIPLTLTSDLDPNTDGRQIQVKVQMAVPSGTQDGSYGTTYGIQSTQ